MKKGEKIKAVTAHFQNDLLQEMVCEYNELGNKVVETPYLEGKKEGLAKIYSPDGKLNLTIRFSQDKKSGLQTQYFPNGTVFREIAYVDDLKNGEEISYFDNGRVASICLYRDDQLEGLSQSWNQEWDPCF